MNPGFPPPPPPDDEAADPLLRALRQRLSDYGQAPPPGAWAAIRQRVPPPPPPPWWRRRHLLAVLGLLVGCLLPGKLNEWSGLRQAGGVAATDNQPSANQAAGQFSLANSAGGRVAQPPMHSQATELAASSDLANRRPATASGAPAPLPQAAKTTATSIPNHTTAGRTASQPQAIATADKAARTHSGTLVATTSRPQHNGSRRRDFTGIATTSHPHRKHSGVAVTVGEGHRARRHSREPAPELTEANTLGGQSASTAVAARSAHSLANRGRWPRAAAPITSGQATSPGTIAGPISKASTKSGLVGRQRAHYATQASGRSVGQATRVDSTGGEMVVAANGRPAFLPSLLYPAGPLALLAPKLPGLLLPPPAPLATLVARPDSTLPPPPVRRWALLVLAGPTVSYRTLGPAPTLAAGHPDFARLERPALGLGAQVQVRRVLSGRWALAVGLGYHEYATRLALSLKDTASVHQRDTYRLLTVPVQLSYALGAPKGRFTKALLLGAEPGWYLGGRSTEGSGCGCEQQAYTSAASSPYRSLSVAFSLGLDLRYRMGGAASRWQWLVQPTGRYVATPFVRNDALGFTPRQPFSLGFLTGFSWDVR